jgi:hypothetical protein
MLADCEVIPGLLAKITKPSPLKNVTPTSPADCRPQRQLSCGMPCSGMAAAAVSLWAGWSEVQAGDRYWCGFGWSRPAADGGGRPGTLRARWEALTSWFPPIAVRQPLAYNIVDDPVRARGIGTGSEGRFIALVGDARAGCGA